MTKELEKINHDLTENITQNHTDVIRNVLKELISMERMGVDLSADSTFDKLMRDLIKYEYIEDDANIPENQFGLGYTNLVMIIAAIMDYMERYPDSSFNSKINLISIEEPETFMHPQMQELFIKNINEATIIDIYGKGEISAIPVHIEKENLYLAYQGEVNGYYATSFEEAFILTNYDNAITNELLKELKGDKRHLGVYCSNAEPEL